MKLKHITFGALSLIISNICYADLYSKATITGTFTDVQVVSSSPKVTKLVKYKISNAAILYSLAQSSVIPTYKGFQIIELFSDSGATQGFYAMNTSSKQLVKLQAISFNDVLNSQVSAPTDSVGSKSAVTNYYGLWNASIFGYTGIESWTGTAVFKSPPVISSLHKFTGFNESQNSYADISVKVDASKTMPFSL